MEGYRGAVWDYIYCQFKAYFYVSFTIFRDYSVCFGIGLKHCEVRLDICGGRVGKTTNHDINTNKTPLNV